MNGREALNPLDMNLRFYVLPLMAGLVLMAGCASNQISPQVSSTLASAGVGPSTTVKMQNGQPLDYDDIVELVRKNVPTHVILGYLQSTGKVYNFGPTQLQALKDQGASSELVNYLQETQGFYGRAPSRRGSNPGGVPSPAYNNSPLYQDEQPFAYNEPLVDDWYNSSYEESLYSPFSFN
ncbi:MAG: hypothetical protein Fur0032_13050 [Terrimicrobiaceae bacterium]